MKILRTVLQITMALMAVVIFLHAPAFAQANVAYRTQLYEHFNPASYPAGSRFYSGVWGYVAPDNREYALLGGYDGTYIIDVTEKPLKLVKKISGANSGWREIKTYGFYAYVVTEGGEGLQVIDLSLLPATATLVNTDRSIFTSAHTISQEGTYLYIHGTGAAAGVNGGTLIYDLAEDAVHPRLVGTWSGRYVHDASIRNDTMYAAAIYAGALDVIYLGKDRSAPVWVTDIVYPGGGTHNAEATANGKYIMTTDEVGATPKTLKVWDRSDISNIRKVADWTSVPGQIIHNVRIRKNIAYISWYTAGTRIVDISNPLNPVEIGFYDTFNGANQTFDGNWDVYPDLPSGKLLLSDIQNGLYVVTFDGSEAGSVSGIVRDQVTNNPIPGARITLPELNKTFFADENGRYEYEGAVDILQYQASALNYTTGNGELVVSSSGIEQDIFLETLPLRSIVLHVDDTTTGVQVPIFSYKIYERPTQGMANSGTTVFELPQDSSYTLRVGAWGYIPKSITISGTTEGTVDVQLMPGYADDAELNLGWSLASPTDDATAGFWERGVPQQVITVQNQLLYITQPGRDNTPDPGTYAFMTGITGSDPITPGSADVDMGTVTLQSPVFNLTGYERPVLEYAVWYSNDVYPDPSFNDDELWISLSTDGGASWNIINTLTSSTNSDWLEVTQDLKQEGIAISDNMMFRIEAYDLGDGSWVEAGLDDFRIYDAGITSVDRREDDANSIVARIIPNPVVDESEFVLQAPGNDGITQVELFNNTGSVVRTLYSGVAAAKQLRVSVESRGLPSGAYMWRALLASGYAAHGTVIIAH